MLRPTSVRNQILLVVEQKLMQALHDVDASTQEQARGAWDGIGPAPTCPPVGRVMQQIHHALASGYRERGRVAKDVVLSTLTPVRGELTQQLVQDVMAVIVKAFPDNAHLTFAHHTPGVYQRRVAPENKFDARIFELELALVSASAANMSRESVASIRTAVDEMLLHEAVAKRALWKRALSAIWRFIALSVGKRLFGIAWVALVALLTYVLGGM